MADRNTNTPDVPENTSFRNDGSTPIPDASSAGNGSEENGGVRTEKTASGAPKKSAGTTAKKSTAGTAGKRSSAQKKSPGAASRKKSGTTPQATAAQQEAELPPAPEECPENTGAQGEAALPPVLWENTLPEKKNAARMPVSSKKAGKPATVGEGVPAPADGHEIGHAVPPVDFPEKITKKSIARRVLTLLLTVAVLGAAMFIFFFRPAEYTEKIGSVVGIYDESANVTAVIVNGKQIGTVNGHLAAKECDGRGYTAVLRTETGELWLVRGGKMRLVSENVTDAVIAAEGGIFAFRTSGGVLYRSGTGKKDTPQLVSGEVPEEPFCLSPDGKDLLYTSGVGGALKAELSSVRKKVPYLTDTGNYRPVAVADQCRYIYLRDSDNTLYIYNSKTVRMTNCGTFTVGSLVFNRDFSEVFFKNEDSCRFYKDGTALTLTGLSGGETLWLLPNQRVAQRENIGGVQVLQKSLLGCYYNYAAVGGNSLAYLTVKKGKVQMEVIHFFDEGTATVTDKYVFFISTDQTQTDRRSNLYSVKTGKTAFERLMSDVAEYCANVDGSRILYRDAHGPLRAMHMGSSPTQLADGFMAGTLCVTLDDTFYFRSEDGTLYRSENGDMPEKVADGVRFAATDAHVAFFLRENGGQYELFTNYRGRRKNTQVLTIPSLPSDDGKTAVE